MHMKIRTDPRPRGKVTPRGKGQGSQGPKARSTYSWWRREGTGEDVGG